MENWANSLNLKEQVGASPGRLRTEWIDYWIDRLELVLTDEEQESYYDYGRLPKRLISYFKVWFETIIQEEYHENVRVEISNRNVIVQPLTTLQAKKRPLSQEEIDDFAARIDRGDVW